MTKKTLSPSKKLVLDNGYLTHITIKWKDVTKNEKAIVTVMGMLYEGSISIPITLQLLGHKGEVLKEKTETTKLESGCSAIQRFEVKSVMGNLKEEDISEITAKIELNGQTLDIPVHNKRLRIATTCLERLHEAEKQNDAKKHPSEKDSYFNWVSNNYTPSKIQNAEAVQDQFNFGSGAYNADPEVFEMEKSIDITQQIKESIMNPNGGMYPYYLRAKDTPSETISFIWYTYKNGNIQRDKDNNPIPKSHSFGGDYLELLKTKAWPFGRVSAIIKNGQITVCHDGSYFIEGKLVYNEDSYSWKPDGNQLQNVAIDVAGNLNHNAPGQDNWGGVITPSIENIPSDRKIKKDSVLWKKASSAYKENANEMPVKYTKDFNFYIYGKVS